MKADLHVHTTFSDGMFSPEEVVKMAKDIGLYGIAITDHDTVSGIERAVEAGKQWGVSIVPGVEISTVSQGQDIHILGYYIDPGNVTLQQRLQQQRNARFERNRGILDKLSQMGIMIREEEVLAKKENGFADMNVGRPHIAEVLMDKGIVQTVEEAFDRFLGKEGAAYVLTPRISPEEAIALIQEAGGAAVLAHPGLYEDRDLVHRLAKSGLAGIEAVHPDHSDSMKTELTKITQGYRLVASAGSDFHGERQGLMYHAPLGACRMEWKDVVRLKQKAAQPG